MARRAIKVIDVVEILVHWHAGRRIGELSSSLAVDPKTVRKYTASAVAAGMAPGGPPLTVEQWSALVEGWFPGLVERRGRQRTWPQIEPLHGADRRVAGEDHDRHDLPAAAR